MTITVCSELLLDINKRHLHTYRTTNNNTSASDFSASFSVRFASLIDSLIMQTNRLLKSFMNPRFAGSVAYRPSAATKDCYHFQTTENATVCKHTYKAAPGLNSVSPQTTFCVTARQGYRIRNLPVNPLHNISEAYRKTMLHICASPLLQRQEV